jgi:hypothetical protein
MKENNESSFEMKETNLFSSTSHHVARVDGSSTPSPTSSNCYLRRPQHGRLDSCNDDSISSINSNGNKIGNSSHDINGFSDSFDDEYDHKGGIDDDNNDDNDNGGNVGTNIPEYTGFKMTRLKQEHAKP